MNIPSEFLPVVEWWEKDGKQTVTYLAIAAVLVGGWYAWKGQRAAKLAAASQSFVSAYTAEELEDAVSKFSGTPTEGALRLRLAKNYFDAGRVQEAYDLYGALEGKAPDGLEDVPVVGKAQCLEALGKFAEAAKAFDAFTESKPNSYLALTAKLGAARALAQAGDRAKALERLAALKESVKDDEISKMRVESTEDCVKRYEKREEMAPKAEAATVEEKPVDEAAKSEEKPVEEAAK